LALIDLFFQRLLQVRPGPQTVGINQPIFPEVTPG